MPQREVPHNFPTHGCKPKQEIWVWVVPICLRSKEYLEENKFDRHVKVGKEGNHSKKDTNKENDNATIHLIVVFA